MEAGAGRSTPGLGAPHGRVTIAGSQFDLFQCPRRPEFSVAKRICNGREPGTGLPEFRHSSSLAPGATSGPPGPLDFLMADALSAGEADRVHKQEHL